MTLRSNLPYRGQAKIKLLINEIAGQRLTPIETAHAINEFLEETRWSQIKLATEMKFDAKLICAYLTLLKLPENIQKLVHEGEVPMWSAVEALRTEEKLREEIFEKWGKGEYVPKSEIRQKKVERKWKTIYEGKSKEKAREYIEKVETGRRFKIEILNG